MIDLDLLRIHFYWKLLVSVSFTCCVRCCASPAVDGKGPRSQQEALKSQILTFIRYLRMCFQTWDNLYVVNNAKSYGKFPPEFSDEDVRWLCTDVITEFQSWSVRTVPRIERQIRSSFPERNRMKSIPDLHVYISWLFVETGNCRRTIKS